MAAEKTSAQDTAPPESPTWAILGFATICGVLGLGFRLDGLGNSLWLDEFGTLWAVEGGLGTVMERVYEFHGQTPFYYVWPWLSIQLFGESEIALRLPSIIFGFGTLSIVYLLGRDGWGKAAGLLAASLLSVSYFAVEADASARPYALVVFFVALMLLGFTRAVLTGSRWGRVLFIAGCSGIFAGSYVMTPMIAGVGGAYLLFRDLRVKYPISQFMLDAGVAFITVTPWLPHLWALWKRRDGLAWITEVNSAFAMELLAPFLFAIVIGSVRAFRGDQPRVIGALTRHALGSHHRPIRCHDGACRSRNQRSFPPVRDRDSDSRRRFGRHGLAGIKGRWGNLPAVVGSANRIAVLRAPPAYRDVQPNYPRRLAAGGRALGRAGGRFAGYSCALSRGVCRARRGPERACLRRDASHPKKPRNPAARLEYRLLDFPLGRSGA